MSELLVSSRARSSGKRQRVSINSKFSRQGMIHQQHLDYTTAHRRNKGLPWPDKGALSAL